MKIALAIPHTPWVDERVTSMTSLLVALDLVEPLTDAGPCFAYREFTERAPNAVWAEKLWTWLFETGADWCLQLQDDVIVAPCFWPILKSGSLI